MLRVRFSASLDVVFFARPGWSSLQVAGRPLVGQSVPAQADEARLRPRLVLLAPGGSTGAGPGAGGAAARVEGALRRDVVAQHDHAVLQVTAGARRAAGGAVQTPLQGEFPLQLHHCSNGRVPSEEGPRK